MVGEIEPTMSQELVAAYLKGPVVVALYIDFADVVRQPLKVAISGLLACRENVPLGQAPSVRSRRTSSRGEPPVLARQRPGPRRAPTSWRSWGSRMGTRAAVTGLVAAVYQDEGSRPPVRWPVRGRW